MKIIKTKIKDLVIIKSERYDDSRGSFREVHKKNVLKQKFVFDCMSISKKNVLRGLHLQTKKAQGKLISVTKGEILDVAVDLRKKSKTYGKFVKLKISEKSDFSFYIPPGFAHGFLCLSNSCCVFYKCTNYRQAKSEVSIKWDDPKLRISWPVKNPILSAKDTNGIAFEIFDKKNNF